MAVSEAQIEMVRDLFAGVGPITTRKMFGGLGIYADGTIFAILMSDGALRLKGVGEMAATFEAEGWELPDDLLDDSDAASAWARRALDAL